MEACQPECQPKPRVCFEFEVEKVIGMSNDGNYRVQWAPTWVSKLHLVDCEHLIDEFLCQRQSEREVKPDPDNSNDVPDNVSELSEENYNERRLERVDDEAKALMFSDNVKEENAVNMSSAVEPPSVSEFHASASGSSMNLVTSDKFGEISDTHEPSQRRSLNLMNSDYTQDCSQADDSYTQDYENVSLLQTDYDPECICEICGAEFSCENTLTVHLSTHRNEEYPYHSDSQWYSCDQCSSSFAKKSTFISHICTNTMEKTFTCPHCDFKFMENDQLKEHLLSHTNRRPFTCEDCGKSFARKYALKTHLRTHTGFKPYRCQVCGKAYSDKSNYNSHTRSCRSSAKLTKH